MGISVQTSGIKVEQGKYYLVNLNADPSLNELLVYYLKVCIMYTKIISKEETHICMSSYAVLQQCVIFLKGMTAERSKCCSHRLSVLIETCFQLAFIFIYSFGGIGQCIT
jgi:hypothetical protein